MIRALAYCDTETVDPVDFTPKQCGLPAVAKWTDPRGNDWWCCADHLTVWQSVSRGAQGDG